MKTKTNSKEAMSPQRHSSRNIDRQPTLEKEWHVIAFKAISGKFNI